jgi:hypothetical protein
MTLEEKLEKAMDLLERASEMFEYRAPDLGWWKEYLLLTGEHAILTEEGWEHPASRLTYLQEDPDWEPLDEVNAPAEGNLSLPFQGPTPPVTDEQYAAGTNWQQNKAAEDVEDKRIEALNRLDMAEAEDDIHTEVIRNDSREDEEKDKH